MARSFITSVFILAAATLVRTDNTPPVIPEDAQIGILYFPVTCLLAGALNQTFQAVFSATAPVFGGTGEEIYYTDTVASIDVPSYLVDLASVVGASQASADVSINLRLINASPSTLLAYKDTIKNISLPSGSDANIRIPPGKGVLPPIGPATLGSPGPAHRIILGQVNVTLSLQDSSGNSVFTQIPVTCGQQNIDFVLGSVNINSSTGLAPFAPANGFVPTFPATSQNQETGSFRFPYPCTFGPLGLETVDLIIGGTIPTYLSTGEQFSFTQADSFLRIPPSLITLAKQAYPSVATFDTTVTEFDIHFSNASPQSFNAAKTPIHSSIDVTGNSTDFFVPIPKTGFLTIGPITAGSTDGVDIAVAVGNANATAVLRDSSGAALLTLPITCAVPAPLEVVAVPISNQGPASYILGVSQTASSSAAAATSSTTTSSALFSLPTKLFRA